MPLAILYRIAGHARINAKLLYSQHIRHTVKQALCVFDRERFYRLILHTDQFCLSTLIKNKFGNLAQIAQPQVAHHIFYGNNLVSACLFAAVLIGNNTLIQQSLGMLPAYLRDLSKLLLRYKLRILPFRFTLFCQDSKIFPMSIRIITDD